MIHFKNSFQKVLIISAVLVSFTRAQPDPEKLDDDIALTSFRLCRDAMINIFGRDQSPLDCIKTAIIKLKLNGDIALTGDVLTYYKSFRDGVLTDNIKRPVQYCITNVTEPDKHTNFLKCLRETEIFEYLLGREDNEPQNTYFYDDGNSTRFKKDIILYNALYHHKQSLSGSLPYYHTSLSYGYFYLTEITRVIQLKDGNLDDPEEFCNKKYNPQDSLEMV